MRVTAIDSHVHIWDRSRGEIFIAEQQFPALTGKAFLPQDLEPVLAETNAESAVLVHGPATVDHALHCLELCHAHACFRSVVGWVDLRSADPTALLDQQARDRAFRGVRFAPMLDADPEDYLRSDAALRICDALRTGGALVEILAPPPLFDAVAALAIAHPDLPVVLAHFGLPDTNPDSFADWQRSMAELAALPNVKVQLSGLPLTGRQERDRPFAQAHVAAMLKLFGADRLLYASNWPVATALVSPRRWRELLDEVLQAEGVPQADQEAIYRTNALQLY